AYLDRQKSRIPPLWLHYGIAVAGTLGAFAVRALLAPVLLDQAPFLLFAPAVLLASAFGGAGPGLVATALALVLGLMTFRHFPHLSHAESIDAGLFAAIGLGISWWGGRLMEKRKRAQATTQNLLAREAHLQSILETIPEAMIVIDEQGIMQSFSTA